ncbi:hypothetical protein ITJ54_09025 [Curtobacterium sp. VKM Ac-2865]|uniref:hypothetical protein n=1 Tax=Curtobacterium sp. VKM Ac-2865 TaxID=2783817 RepID=UPI00188D9A6D|nr:hypothetical protein [Curtobacterium sp. VKM Ac-2865]MBF4582809.1 hypothetical protein [Curtobacterium sp. VKM Ac-2865]
MPGMTDLGLAHLGRTPEIALTLFRLRDGLTEDDYRTFSRDTVRPGMLTMPSVLGFLDYRVAGGLTALDGWELVEVIVISSRVDFEHENATAGAALATEWEGWVADFRVLFLEDLVSSAGPARLAG